MSEIYVKCKPEEAERYVINGLIFKKGILYFRCEGRECQVSEELQALGAEPQKRLLPPERGPWELKYGKDCSGQKPAGTMFWSYEQAWEPVSPGIWSKSNVYAIPLPSTQESQSENPFIGCTKHCSDECREKCDTEALQRESVEEAKEVGLRDSGASIINDVFVHEIPEKDGWYWACFNVGDTWLKPQPREIVLGLSDRWVIDPVAGDWRTHERWDVLWCHTPIPKVADYSEYVPEDQQAEPQEQPPSPTKQESPGEGYRWLTEEEKQQLPREAECRYPPDGKWFQTLRKGLPIDGVCDYRIPISTQEPTVEKKIVEGEFWDCSGVVHTAHEAHDVFQEGQKVWVCNFNPLSVSKEGGEA